MLIVGFGNVILDYVVQINDANVLKEYKLKEDEAREVEHEEFQTIIKDVTKRYEYVTNPGGVVQNTLRTIQWLSKGEHKTVMFGAIGGDETGVKLEKLMEEAGVETKYMRSELPTGAMIAFTLGKTRSFIGNIGASSTITTSWIKEHESIAADFIYMESFFLTERLQTARYILDCAKTKGKTFIFNLSGTYMCEALKDEVKEFAEASEILFGNLSEYSTLSVDYAEELSSKNPKKIVVVTNGENPVIIFSGGSRREISLPYVEEILDTTGAGDSFVAGFLHAFFKGKSLENCARSGFWVASRVMKMLGCSFPDDDLNEFYNIN